jgi:hypothetical protein
MNGNLNTDLTLRKATDPDSVEVLNVIKSGSQVLLSTANLS